MACRQIGEIPGFLNGYSTADAYQDKAEVFACLLLPSWYKSVEASCLKTDSFLNAKCAFARNAISEVSMAMNDAFFERLHKE